MGDTEKVEKKDVYREFGPLLIEAIENKNHAEHEEMRKAITQLQDAVKKLSADKLDPVTSKDDSTNTADVKSELNKTTPYDWMTAR